MRNNFGERRTLLKAMGRYLSILHLPCAVFCGITVLFAHCPPLHYIPCLSHSRVAVTELNSWSVVLGSLQREGLSPGAEEVGVISLKLPRAYNHYSQGSDLALLQLAQPTAHTPICLPQPTHRFPFGTSCWATGWDQDNNDGKHYSRLKLKEALCLPTVIQRQLPTVPASSLPCFPGPKPLFCQLPEPYGICICV